MKELPLGILVIGSLWWALPPVSGAAGAGENEQIDKPKAENAGAIEKTAPSPGVDPRLLFSLDLAPPGAKRGVTSVAFSPDGKMILAGSTKGLALLNAVTGEKARNFSTDRIGMALFTPGGQQVVATCGRVIGVWNVDDEKPARSFNAAGENLALSPDGKIAVSNAGEEEAYSIFAIDLESGKILNRFTGHTRTINGLIFRPDGKGFYSTGQDRSIREWDLATGRQIRELGLHGRFGYTLDVSPNLKTLASASWDKTIKLWDVESGKLMRTIAYRIPLRTGFYLPDGKRILASDGKEHQVHLLEIETCKELATFTGHSNSVRNLDVSPDGKRAVTGSDDGTLKVWVLEDRTP